MMLLFGNAFGACHRLRADRRLAQPRHHLIGAQISGDVLHNPVSATRWRWA